MTDSNNNKPEPVDIFSTAARATIFFGPKAGASYLQGAGFGALLLLGTVVGSQLYENHKQKVADASFVAAASAALQRNPEVGTTPDNQTLKVYVGSDLDKQEPYYSWPKDEDKSGRYFSAPVRDRTVRVSNKSRTICVGTALTADPICTTQPLTP